MKVLVTRAEAPGKRTAERLRRAGHEPVLLPLIRYRDTGAALPEGPFDAIVFTSAAAIATLSARMAANPSLSALASLSAFCVGEATAKAARAAGFADAHAGPGTGAELIGFIAGKLPTGAGKSERLTLFYPAPADRAFDLAKAASAHGIDVVETVIYSAELLDPSAEALARALDECAGGAAFLYSRRSAQNLADLATKHATIDSLARLTLIAISENVAEAIAGRGARILVSQMPHEDGLFELLDRLESGGSVYQG